MNKNMNICEELEKYEEQCIYFCEPIKNNIINDGNFIRILYSKPFVLLNGIYLYFSLNIHSIEKYYNKLKCNFHIDQHINIIEKINHIENNILKKLNLNKIPQYKLSEQFKNGNVKIFNDFTNIEASQWNGKSNFVLKISGVWENELYYGLTFKFVKSDCL
jgi:hypothetical protein